MEKEENYIRKKSSRNEKANGITLIALVITIIILLILAGTAITLAINGGGLFAHANNAAISWNVAVENENSSLASLLDTLNSTNNSSETPSPGTPSNDNNEPTITVGNTQTVITPENVSDYIGRIVLDAGTAVGDTTGVKVIARVADTSGIKLGSTTATNEQITIGGDTYNISTRYRLLYVDFDNKYGDGAGTIYLKADPTNGQYGNWNSPISNIEATKLRQLNPMLYNTNGVSAPSNDNPSMDMSAWLLDPEVWKDIKNSEALSSISSNINYVVGAPTLEMLIDSYNMKYNLTNTTPDYNARTADSERTKLEYYYGADCDGGYKIGPVAGHSSPDAYSFGSNTFMSDPSVGTLYKSDDPRFNTDYTGYWIASPGKKHREVYMLYSYFRINNNLICQGAGYDTNSLMPDSRSGSFIH